MDSVGYKNLKKFFFYLLFFCFRHQLLHRALFFRTLLHKVKLLTLIFVFNIISGGQGLSFQNVQKPLFALQIIFYQRYLFFSLLQIFLESLIDQT